MILLPCDIETQGLHAVYDKSCKILTVQFWINDRPVVYEWDGDEEIIRNILGQRTADDAYMYQPVFINATFDVAVLWLHNVDLNPQWHDLALAHYLLRPCGMEHHSMDSMAKEYLDIRKMASPSTWEVVTPQLLEYALRDIEVTHQLTEPILSELRENEALYNYYTDIEIPYQHVLTKMKQQGAQIDVTQLSPVRDEWSHILKQRKAACQALMGYKRGKSVASNSFYSIGNGELTSKISEGVWQHCELKWMNPSSQDDRLAAFKRQGLKLSSLEKVGKSGKPSLDKAVLEELAEDFELAAKLVEYNAAQKFVTAFLNPLEELTKDANIVRTDLRQTQTRTTRLSAANPNLQQIPAGDTRGAAVRRLFIAPKGYRLLVGDLDRIELVVFAFYLEAMLGDSTLANRIRSGEDVHSSNMEAWGIKVRRVAKIGIFLLIYGGGANRLAVSCGLDHAEANRIYKRIQRDLPIEEYAQCMLNYAREHDGYIDLYFGGRVYIPEVYWKGKSAENKALRLCSNYPIQGTAAQVFKYLQVLADKQAIATPVIPVHDESLYIKEVQFSRHAAEKLTDVYTRPHLMESGYDTYVPVSATFYVAKNWYLGKVGEDLLKEYHAKVPLDKIAANNKCSIDEVELFIQENM